MPKIHSVKYNFLMNFILTASGFIFPLITFPYISRVLTEVGNGRVSFAAAYANYFLMVAQLGIPTYGIRACARVRDNKEQLSRTYQELMLINLITTSLVTASYLISLAIIPALYEDRTMFLINSITFFLQFLGSNWLFQAMEQYDYITIRSIVFKIISIVLMFVLVHSIDDAVVYCAITVLAAVGSNILNFIHARRFVSFRKTGAYDLKQHVKPIMILFAQSLAISIYTNLDTIMLGFMKTKADVGYYTAATRLKLILASLVTSLGQVLLPRMSYFVKKKMKAEFARIMVKALNFALFISIPLALFFAISAGDCLQVIAGDRYIPATMTMTFLSLTIIPIGITNILGIQVLTPLERERDVMISVIAGAVTDLVLNFIFIPMYASTGAAFATLIAEVVVLALQMYFARNITNPVRKKIYVAKYACIGLAAAVPTFLLNLLPIPFPLLSLILCFVVFVGIYVGLLHLVKDSMLTESIGGLKRKIAAKRGKLPPSDKGDDDE